MTVATGNAVRGGHARPLAALPSLGDASPESYLKPLSLGGGVWRIPVPIMGVPVVYTLVYAVECDDGLVLVDAGWDDQESWDALTTGLASFGLSVSDVRGVVATHHHPDHAGLADRIRATSGAWVAMHEADVDLMQRVAELGGAEEQLQWEIENLRRAGADDADIDELVEQGSMGGTPTPPVADLAVSDGDLIDAPGRALRVVWSPGHTPGHMCLHLEDSGAVFTGDHVLSNTTAHIGAFVYPLGDPDPLGEYLHSLGRVLTIGQNTLLPAHERSVADLPRRVADIVDHHQKRLTEVHGVLSGGSLTLWQAASHMSWSQPWADMTIMSRQLALAEAAAHVRHLVTLGAAYATGPESRTRYQSISGGFWRPSIRIAVDAAT